MRTFVTSIFIAVAAASKSASEEADDYLSHETLDAHVLATETAIGTSDSSSPENKYEKIRKQAAIHIAEGAHQDAEMALQVANCIHADAQALQRLYVCTDALVAGVVANQLHSTIAWSTWNAGRKTCYNEAVEEHFARRAPGMACAYKAVEDVKEDESHAHVLTEFQVLPVVDADGVAMMANGWHHATVQEIEDHPDIVSKVLDEMDTLNVPVLIGGGGVLNPRYLGGKPGPLTLPVPDRVLWFKSPAPVLTEFQVRSPGGMDDRALFDNGWNWATIQGLEQNPDIMSKALDIMVTDNVPVLLMYGQKLDPRSLGGQAGPMEVGVACCDKVLWVR